MARITPGNRLYLYALFKREIGVGRQTMLSALDDIVRVTVFKKGRVYVTLIPRPDFDEILEAPVEKPQPQQQQQKKAPGKKSWKQKKANKVPQPTKPRPHNRPVEPEPEPEPIEVLEPVVETPVAEPEATQPEVLAGDQTQEVTAIEEAAFSRGGFSTPRDGSRRAVSRRGACTAVHRLHDHLGTRRGRADRPGPAGGT